jgi:phosphoadenosine phosphosulfate reductase
MWNLIPQMYIPPTRQARYCCKYLKEDGGDGRMTVTGVRWAESVNRSRNQGIAVVHGEKTIPEGNEDNFRIGPRQGGLILVNDNDDSRRVLEQCYKRKKTTVNPIIEWSDSEVWEFIRENKLPYCSLYDEGFHRLGCIGCPNARRKGRERDFIRWPKYKWHYLYAFTKLLEVRKEKNKPFRAHGIMNENMSAIDIYNWWLEYDILPGQYNLFEDYEEDDE